MTRPELSTGEALVGLLEAYGVDTIFGIPGVHNVEMYRALPRSGIRHYLTRHEQGAGFMADGYARATGKPGVCFTITGPGLLNILTPLGQAWSDSSRVLVVSSALDIKDSAQGRGRLHEMLGQHKAAESVTATAMAALTPQDVQDAMARAFSLFASARPRPSYLEIPLDLLSTAAGPGWQPRPAASLPHATARDCEAAATQLKAAKSPMILLGGGAMNAGAAALRISEALGAPVITTTAGKGVVRADHPNVWDYRMGLPDVQARLQASDCVLAVGTELSETDFWASNCILDNLIRIDIDPAAIARPHRAKLAILGDAAPALEAIANALGGGKKAAPPAPPTDDSPLRSLLSRVLKVIRDSLPEETVIASDMTQIAYAANEIFPMYEPRTWLHPVGFGTLGFAVPAAIGAKIGVGPKPTVAMIGDYGFQYTLNELGTAVEHNLSLPILLWNNDALGQIRDDMVNKAIQPNAVFLRNPDFQMLAKAYGARAERPENLKALATAIAASLKAEGPTLIEMTPRMVQG
ncbi:MAG: 5-guanidino-2-oxopentanoate decarboxylase [Proteobacteria bacterium]|nr:5-guanidino-2-oxopentanoate decarboxylase [Pseudomonadota bacterium]